MNTIRVIRTSSREKDDLLTGRVAELRALGFSVHYDDIPVDPTWPYVAGSAKDRVAMLSQALEEPDTKVILCARGGYGASDLLPLLDFERLKKAPPKLVVGFSDVSAIHSALYTKLGWPGLHAPMPATVLWRKDSEERDIAALMAIIRLYVPGSILSGAIEVRPLSGVQSVSGRLFGGCFTVLTNLIGTSYLPSSLAGHIVFIEDTDENPPRLMRALNQWLQAGLFKGAKALVVGHLRNLGEKIEDCAPYVYQHFALRAGPELPVFSSNGFGHTCPNFPMLIAADATIEGTRLSWTFQCPSVITPKLTLA